MNPWTGIMHTRSAGIIKVPYAPYKLVDPYYHYFNYDETTCTYWQPIEPERWLDTDKK